VFRAADLLRPAGLVAVAAAALLAAHELSAQDVLSFGKTFVRAEPVAGSLVSIGGDVHLSGAVARDLIVLGGDAVLEPGARVTGDLLVMGGSVRGANARASVSGEVRTVPALEAAFLSEIETSPAAGRSAFGLLIALRLALLCLWLVTGSFLLFLAPRRLALASEAFPSSAPLDALLGAIALLSGTLLSAFLLAVLPARLALVAMALVLLFLLAAKAFGLAVLFLRIGRRLSGGARRGTTFWGDPSALALGLVLLGALSLVPLAGRIVWMAASLVAIGVALGTGFGRAPDAESSNLTLSARRA
jgi:hypothetical protein